MKKRKSNIELLKIISLLLITIQHCIMSADLKTGFSTDTPFLIIADIFRFSGLLGTVIFVICSSYFLLDSKNSNSKKVMYIIADTLAISIIWFIPCFIFNINLTHLDIVKEFLPIYYYNNWFIGWYLLLYLLHPFLNIIIKNVNKKQLFRINMFLIVIFILLQYKVYYSNIILFIIIYFVVAYMKKYMKGFCKSKKLNYNVLILSSLLYVLSILIPNFLGLHYTFFNDKMFFIIRNVYNPLNILIGISLFNIFNMKIFYNSFINYVSSISLIFYVLHENILFRIYFRPLIYKKLLTINDSIYLWIFVMTIVIFIFGIALSIVYKETLQKVVHKATDKIYSFASSKYVKIEKRMI